MKCSVRNCGNQSRSNGLCRKHYQRYLRHGDPKTVLKVDNKTHPDGGDGCSVEGCDGKFHCHGFCQKHYVRWKRHGDPTFNNTEQKSRFLTESVIPHKGKRDCLHWPFKGRAGRGYPTMRYGGEQRYVHRVACELTHGPAPSPIHESAHSCGHGFGEHGGCVNPHHLRWATPAENTEDKRKHGTHGRNQHS